jgi:hypothetical protein
MKTNNIPQVKMTKNYDLFEMHPCNRPLHKNDPVETSMRRVGFMPSSPLHCIKNGNGKLKIIRGHHRFSIAKKLGLPVYYIIDNSNTDIFELEGSSTGSWNAGDFAVARARAGNADIQKMLDFKDRHGLTLGSASSLMMGQSAISNNAPKQIKSGRFKVGDMDHANKVVRLTDMLRERGVAFASSSGFVAAVSAALRIPEIDYSQLVHRASMYSHVLSKRGTVREYLQEIEGLYNYNSKKKLFPLAIRAEEVSRERAVAKNFAG